MRPEKRQVDPSRLSGPTFCPLSWSLFRFWLGVSFERGLTSFGKRLVGLSRLGEEIGPESKGFLFLEKVDF